MIRLFCDGCGAECKKADEVMRQMFSLARMFRRDWPIRYLCDSCYKEYARKIDELEKDIDEKEAALAEARKRLEDYKGPYVKEEGA